MPGKNPDQSRPAAGEQAGERKSSPWGKRVEAGVTPFRKRKVGSTEAVPVAATALKPETAEEGEAPRKKRGPKRTPPRKGGKRPSVAARKAAQKAAKANGKAKKKKASAKRRKK